MPSGTSLMLPRPASWPLTLHVMAETLPVKRIWPSNAWAWETAGAKAANNAPEEMRDARRLRFILRFLSWS
ncbi:hypothetical protein D3C72_2464800 [compost metagenome]